MWHYDFRVHPYRITRPRSSVKSVRGVNSLIAVVWLWCATLRANIVSAAEVVESLILLPVRCPWYSKPLFAVKREKDGSCVRCDVALRCTWCVMRCQVGSAVTAGTQPSPVLQGWRHCRYWFCSRMGPCHGGGGEHQLVAWLVLTTRLLIISCYLCPVV